MNPRLRIRGLDGLARRLAARAVPPAAEAAAARTGVALADMTSMWTEMLKYKKDSDLTGNGVNHPNDFGHRVYAQVLSSLLIDDPKPAASGQK